MSLEDDVLQELGIGIEESQGALRRDLARLRTGRANASLLDSVRVDYYGASTPVAQCAQITVPEPRLIVLKPWDRGILATLEKAIMNADLGVMPQNDGEQIRLPIPVLTEERRKELMKKARQRGEEAKITLRTHRRDANQLLKDAEKDKELSQDDVKRAAVRVQDLVDKATVAIDGLLNQKEQEIHEI